jgi:hypothetical protein
MSHAVMVGVVVMPLHTGAQIDKSCLRVPYNGKREGYSSIGYTPKRIA